MTISFKKGYQVDDMGTNASDPVDYPDVGAALAEAVGEGKSRGILVCGTGAGWRLSPTRCRRACRRRVRPVHGGTGCCEQRCPGHSFWPPDHRPGRCRKLIDIWLDSEFQGGRSAPKVAKIDNLDGECRGQRSKSVQARPARFQIGELKGAERGTRGGEGIILRFEFATAGESCLVMDGWLNSALCAVSWGAGRWS